MKKGYSRRQFIKQNSLAGIGAIALGSSVNCGSRMKTGRDHLPQDDGDIRTMEDMGLKQLYDRYRVALFNRFIPNMDELVIDHELGGFMCNLNIATRKLESTNKQTWYQGRGIWVYSYLYNNFGKDAKFLEVAYKAKEFMVPLLPKDDRFCPAMFLKDGTPRSTREGNIYGNLFVAEGLAEYALASGESKWFDLAREVLFKAVGRYDRADYSYEYKAENPVAGPRIFGHWMILVSVATQMLRQRPDDEELQALADRCVEAIMVHHLSREYRLVNEALAHDLSPLRDPIASQYADIGHGCEAFAFVMNYAVFRKDAALFEAAAGLFKRHVAVASDALHGGYFHILEHAENYTWELGKRRWLHEEVLLGAMSIIEHTGDPWAIKCFLETDAYVQEKFGHPEYAFVVDSGDRRVDKHSVVRAENYHHPRQLMVSLLAMDRIIKRDFKASGLFN